LFHATSFDTGVLFLLYGFHGLLLTNLSWKQPQNLQPLSTNYPMLTSVTINMHNCAFFSILYIYTWSDNNNVFLENSKDVISSGREVYLRCTFQSCPDRGDTTAN
jgi:tRNA(His) 5'-end guanylyltransferase